MAIDSNYPEPTEGIIWETGAARAFAASRPMEEADRIIASRVLRQAINEGVVREREKSDSEKEKLKRDKDHWHSAWASVGNQHDHYVQNVQRNMQALYDSGDMPKPEVLKLAKALGVLIHDETGRPIFGKD